MIKLIVSLLIAPVLLVGFVGASGCASSGKKKSSSAAAPFEIRKFQTEALANGLTILWIPDDSLPYVSLQMMVRSGSSQDPTGKEGLANFTGALLEKGTNKRDATQISEDLEQIGSGFSVETQPDYSIASTSALSFNRDDILAQFAEIVMHPSFPPKEIERHRQMMLGSLQKLADRPDDFVEFLLPKYLYGNHPYGHEPSGSAKSLRVLKAADIKAFYESNYSPGNAVLAVVGQYDNAWKKSVTDAFGQWKKSETHRTTVPPFPAWSGTELLLLDRADLKQAQIQILFKGVPRSIPEFLPVRAALKVLGESFGSRLFEEIREKRGLTYHINAWFDPRLEAGPMGIYTFTRLDKIGEIVEQTLKVYRDFVATGVTEAEVLNVKALMRGQFPRSFETPEALARQLLLLNRYGVPVDYLNNYFANVDAMSKASIDAAIKKYFDPVNLKIIVYAPRASAEETMKKLGKVEVKNYQEFLK